MQQPDLPLIDEPEIYLVNPGGWLERVIGAFQTELARGHAAELGVNQKEQASGRSALAATPIAEERRDVWLRCHHRSQLLR
jgi:hypothetical protein